MTNGFFYDKHLRHLSAVNHQNKIWLKYLDLYIPSIVLAASVDQKRFGLSTGYQSSFDGGFLSGSWFPLARLSFKYFS